MSFRNPEGQLWRWLQVLSEYNFEIQYRPGAQHRNADGLSRRPCHECRHCDRQESKDSVEDIGCPGHQVRVMNFDANTSSGRWVQPWSDEQLRAWQREDPIVAKVIGWMQNGEKPPWSDLQMEGTAIRTFRFNFEQLELINHILYRKVVIGGRTSHPLVAHRQYVNRYLIFCMLSAREGTLGSHARVQAHPNDSGGQE